MAQTNTNKQDNLQLLPTIDTNKALKETSLAVKLGEGMKSHIAGMKGLSILPAFGDIVTVLGFFQSISQVIEKAKYETTEHFVMFIKGGNKIYVPVMDGEAQAKGRDGSPLFNVEIEGGVTAFKKERYLISPADHGEGTHSILIPFKSSALDNFNVTVGEGLQVAEQSLFTRLVTGQKLLKNKKPFHAALQIGDKVFSTNMVANNGLDASYLHPDTYKGKSEKTNNDTWNAFCKAVYQNLKRVLSANNEKMSINAIYKAITEVK